jgi:hypothetical protein
VISVEGWVEIRRLRQPMGVSQAAIAPRLDFAEYGREGVGVGSAAEVPARGAGFGDGRIRGPDPVVVGSVADDAGDGDRGAMRAAASGTLVVLPGLITAIVGLSIASINPRVVVAFVVGIAAVVGSEVMVGYGFARRSS